MKQAEIHTQFASAARSEPQQLQAQRDKLQRDIFNTPPICDMLNSVLDISMVLNHNRQIIFVNKTMQDLFGITDIESVYGKRPGEVLHCVHANKTAGGCGTTENCSQCGAVLAILNSQTNNIKDRRECRIITDRQNEAMEFCVCTTPFDIDGERYVFCALVDISHEKRRQVLERIFFHDLINSAGALWSWARVFEMPNIENKKEIAAHIGAAAQRLLEEIKAQRELLAAEHNELVLQCKQVNTMSLLQEVTAFYEQHEVSCKKKIVLASQAQNLVLQSDPALLGRVLSNMLKNALEACSLGDTVTIDCRAQKELVEFSVHNPGVIPRHIQLQIFQRSFSTKGSGRGLGTYSMKLLSERYLHGTIEFVSNERQGTIFFARYPLADKGFSRNDK